MNIDTLVVGGGFKGMMAAYGQKRQGKDVAIVEPQKILGGFLAPLNWNGVEVDKGPQFIDDVDEQLKDILHDAVDDDSTLIDLGYQYASYWNGKLTQEFAIPDYRTLPQKDKEALLWETLTNQVSPNEVQGSLKELFDAHGEKTSSYLTAWCTKGLQHSPEELSPLARGLVTFYGRKLLFDDKLSKALKESSIGDAVFAAQKATLNTTSYNYYPKGKTLGAFRESFERQLQNIGVELYLENSVKSVEKNTEGLLVTLAGGESINCKKLIWSASITQAKGILCEDLPLFDKIKAIPQVFYLIEADISDSLPYYVMDYSEHSLTRITNISAYSNKSKDGRSIICVEVPATIGGEIWNDPEAHFKTVKKELEEIGALNGEIYTFNGFKIPSTFNVPLKGYEDALASGLAAIKDRFGSSVVIPSPHLLTRAQIMRNLIELGVINAAIANQSEKLSCSTG